MCVFLNARVALFFLFVCKCVCVCVCVSAYVCVSPGRWIMFLAELQRENDPLSSHTRTHTYTHTHRQEERMTVISEASTL